MFAIAVNRLLKRDTVCCLYMEKLVLVHEGNIYSCKVTMLVWD